MARWLVRLGIIYGHPEKIEDLYLFDTEYDQFDNIYFRIGQICLVKQDRIDKILDQFFSNRSHYYRKVCSANVIKSWSGWLVELEMLCNLTRFLADGMGIPPDRALVISPYAILHKKLNMGIGSACVIRQSRNDVVRLVAMPLWLIVRQILSGMRRASSGARSRHDIGVSATWDIDFERRNDFFWWRDSGIPPHRLVYLFDRPDFQLTPDRARKACGIGVQSFALHSFAVNGAPDLLIEERQALREVIRSAFLFFRMGVQALFSGVIDREILFQLRSQHVTSAKMIQTYRRFGLRAILNYQEGGTDFPTLAAEAVGAVRVGFHWSCFQGPSCDTLRTHHVFFAWGWHDARVCLDSGSASMHLLIGGCPINETRSQERYRREAREAVIRMRCQGVRYTLALFDASSPSPHFYRFFLQWLIDDPSLSLLIKSKGREWPRIHKDGLGGLVKRALDTGRIYTLEVAASPTDAAMACDFSIGLGTPSAVIMAALEGARVLYLDRGKLDSGPLQQYAFLHRLGPNRCVFHDLPSLREAVEQYAQDPGTNPHLGDASPVLDQIDPFRDGRASQRIGEYVRWYLEGLDSGLGRDRALRRATRQYADKWGEDKVVRGLET